MKNLLNGASVASKSKGNIAFKLYRCDDWRKKKICWAAAIQLFFNSSHIVAFNNCRLVQKIWGIHSILQTRPNESGIPDWLHQVDSERTLKIINKRKDVTYQPKKQCMKGLTAYMRTPFFHRENRRKACGRNRNKRHQTACPWETANRTWSSSSALRTNSDSSWNTPQDGCMTSDETVPRWLEPIS